VPAAFGGPFDAFARAYFAAQIMGVQARTHDAVFNGIFVDHVVKTGTPEEIADLYAKLGVNRQKFLDTMASDAVKAKFAAAREFGLRTGIEGTPTLVVNGKYRIAGRVDTGYPGMFRTLEFLLEKERALAKAPKKG
jgi:thiol:disulfide interchange protein DsbA